MRAAPFFCTPCPPDPTLATQVFVIRQRLREEAFWTCRCPLNKIGHCWKNINRAELISEAGIQMNQLPATPETKLVTPTDAGRVFADVWRSAHRL
jgi:hypothetical protein